MNFCPVLNFEQNLGVGREGKNLLCVTDGNCQKIKRLLLSSEVSMLGNGVIIWISTGVVSVVYIRLSSKISAWVNSTASYFFPSVTFRPWHFGCEKFYTASLVKQLTLCYVFCSQLGQVWFSPYFINFVYFIILEKIEP